MATDVVDAPLYENTTDIEARPLGDGVAQTRRQLGFATRELLAIPEAALAKPWPWKGDSPEGEEIRYAAYRSLEALDKAAWETRVLVARSGRRDNTAVHPVAAATAARWDLHGVLAPLADDSLDADPGSGEWTVRRTLAHVIGGQRSYGYATAWWQAHRHAADDPGLPRRTPEEVYAAAPDEADEATGTLTEVRARFDDVLDRCAERLAGIPDERLGYGTPWSGFAVTIEFRLGRWSSHIREHTVQVEKTLATLGREPTEPERLARLILAAYGRAEAELFARPEIPEAVHPLIRAVTEAVTVLHDARETAAG